jgi:hypothetical protein
MIEAVTLLGVVGLVVWIALGVTLVIMSLWMRKRIG